ncbi:uncharacterized protein B0H64DRAFT_125458 [Chaetomium fimeti]|uniref:Uncharacterized protein n=1 Tax=Chaetomium fimeti TaxID=1854472 RepID=A0AAE0HJ39_9PEZI|nr:hypothetical protein B0H64DRAFT_125458 [Chaetomium fimeti]
MRLHHHHATPLFPGFPLPLAALAAPTSPVGRDWKGGNPPQGGQGATTDNPVRGPVQSRCHPETASVRTPVVDCVRFRSSGSDGCLVYDPLRGCFGRTILGFMYPPGWFSSVRSPAAVASLTGSGFLGWGLFVSPTSFHPQPVLPNKIHIINNTDAGQPP